MKDGLKKLEEKAETRRKKELKKRRLPFAEKTKETYTASWEGIGYDTLIGLIMAVTTKSGAIMLGRSRDRGALSVRIYHDDFEVETLWISDDSQGETELELISDFFRNMET